MVRVYESRNLILKYTRETTPQFPFLAFERHIRHSPRTRFTKYKLLTGITETKLLVPPLVSLSILLHRRPQAALKTHHPCLWSLRLPTVRRASYSVSSPASKSCLFEWSLRLLTHDTERFQTESRYVFLYDKLRIQRLHWNDWKPVDRNSYNLLHL